MNVNNMDWCIRKGYKAIQENGYEVTLYDKVKIIKRIKKLELHLFLAFCHETDKELEVRHETMVY